MADGKVYLASDLASLLNVPRTTINDWLSRYAAFIDSETRGKRRVYFESSVAVLREIAALRTADRSAFDIEKKLEARYGVRPEIAPVSGDPAAESETPGGLVRRTVATAGSAPDIAELVRRLDELKQLRRSGAGHIWTAFALLLILLAALSGAAGWFFLQWNAANERDRNNLLELVSSQLEQNRELSGELRTLRDENARQVQENRELMETRRLEINESLEMLKQDNSRLKTELTERQDKIMEKLEKSGADEFLKADDARSGAVGEATK